MKSKQTKRTVEMAWAQARTAIQTHNDRLKNDPIFLAERKAAVDASNAALTAFLAKRAAQKGGR